MIINYTNETRDFAKLMAAYWNFSRLKWLSVGIIGFLILYVVYAYIRFRLLSAGFLIIPIILIIFAFLACRSHVIFLFYIGREQFWGIHKWPVGEHRIETTENGIRDVTAHEDRMLMWSAFRSYIVTDEFVFIYTAGYQGIAVPRSVVSGQDFEQLQALLRRNLRCEHDNT